MMCKKCKAKMNFVQSDIIAKTVNHYVCPKCHDRVQFCDGKWQSTNEYFIDDVARINYERKIYDTLAKVNVDHSISSKYIFTKPII